MFDPFALKNMPASGADFDPKLVVYLTDLDGKFPKEPPPFDVLWVATTRAIAPFGETIPMLG